MFSNNTQSRLSIDQEIDASTTDHLQQEPPISSSEKSALVMSLSREPTGNKRSNPYAQFFKRLHQTEKSKRKHSYTKLFHSPGLSTVTNSS